MPLLSTPQFTWGLFAQVYLQGFEQTIKNL
jgi:hypothetical protein